MGQWFPPINPGRVYARLEKLEAWEKVENLEGFQVFRPCRKTADGQIGDLSAAPADGAAWYAARDVCAALGLDSRKVLRLLPKGYKRTVYEERGRYMKVRITLITLEGARTLIRLRGGLSLSEAMLRLGCN